MTLDRRPTGRTRTLDGNRPKDGAPQLDWPVLAQGRQTVVVYMGVTTAPFIARRLISHGMAPGTPVAVAENGTLPDQRVLTGTLGGLGALIASNGVKAPALIIIGEVVSLSNVLTQADAAFGVAV